MDWQGGFMQTFKRSIVLQMAIFMFFFFFGLDDVLRALIQRSTIYTIFEGVGFVLVIAAGVIWYLKTSKETIVIVTDKELTILKYVLYVIAFSLILGVLTSGFENGQLYFRILSGAITSIASLFGFYTGYLISKN